MLLLLIVILSTAFEYIATLDVRVVARANAALPISTYATPYDLFSAAL